jgi:hypothetical protein
MDRVITSDQVAESRDLDTEILNFETSYGSVLSIYIFVILLLLSLLLYKQKKQNVSKRYNLA